jgi:hypothetical protein
MTKKLTSSRTFALATLAAIAVGLATPALAMTYNRNGAERSDLVYVPGDGGCISHRAWCDLARY